MLHELRGAGMSADSGASAPTVTFFEDDDGEGGVDIPVDALPGWHEHPECPHGNEGKPLRHFHGGLYAPLPPHTHLPVVAYGEAVPLPASGGA